MENENIDKASIKYLFAKPFKVGFYAYGINSIDELNLIDKTGLMNILFDEFKCKEYDKVNYLISRNFPLYFDVKENKIKEFKKFGEDLTREDIFNSLFENTTPIKKSQSIYEMFFSENSKLYQNEFKINFYGENYGSY